jgi:hypothetical protein
MKFEEFFGIYGELMAAKGRELIYLILLSSDVAQV